MYFNPALKFTSEKEESESLAFLDVKIQKRDSKFITSVYRKDSYARLDRYVASLHY